MTCNHMVSVCIATYNGERFIRQQLESILEQLSSDDEVVISDDSSEDSTVAIIKGLADPRISLYENQQFRSPIGNFGYCLSQSKGAIVYLADQDDLWMPGKVHTVNTVFRNDSSITLVASDGVIIDGDGRVIRGTLYPENAQFSSSAARNLIRNRFVGCTLAFRREMIQILLPIPAGLPMHDSWIGILCRLFGKVHFIDKPLIAYRRHCANYTPSSRSGVAKMVQWRLGLALNIVRRVWKHRRLLMKRSLAFGEIIPHSTRT